MLEQRDEGASLLMEDANLGGFEKHLQREEFVA